MSEKVDLLANMNREQLIKIIAAEKARMAKREIEVDPSSDDDTLRRVLTKLNLRTIRKHAQKFGITITQEQIVEETVSRKTIARTTATVAQDTIEEELLEEELAVEEEMSRAVLLIELAKLESQGLTKELVIRWARDKKLRVEEKGSLIETIDQFEDDFLRDIHLTFTTGKTGRGLEVRFAQWLRQNSNLLVMGIEVYNRDPVKLRHMLTGISGVTHEVDIYAAIESQLEGRVIKETIHPGALFLISCKSTRAKMDKSHIAEWISIVRDILHNEQNQIVPGVEMVVIVSRQGFTPDAIRFARANPIFTYFINENNVIEVDVRVPLLLFEQRGPTDFVQVSPTEEDIKYFKETFEIDLEYPYEFKLPKDWSYDWLLPDI